MTDYSSYYTSNKNSGDNTGKVTINPEAFGINPIASATFAFTSDDSAHRFFIRLERAGGETVAQMWNTVSENKAPLDADDARRIIRDFLSDERIELVALTRSFCMV
ncbi:hypothetical protein N9937_00050 [bacterium]|nr:hypothetical protein [bacterium]